MAPSPAYLLVHATAAWAEGRAVGVPYYLPAVSVMHNLMHLLYSTATAILSIVEPVYSCLLLSFWPRYTVTRYHNHARISLCPSPHLLTMPTPSPRAPPLRTASCFISFDACGPSALPYLPIPFARSDGTVYSRACRFAGSFRY